MVTPVCCGKGGPPGHDIFTPDEAAKQFFGQEKPVSVRSSCYESVEFFHWISWDSAVEKN